MKLKGAQAVVRALEKEGAAVIFGYPGAAICPFYDALLDSDIKHVLSRHEQGAVHAASGYARVTGKTGVCVATSGPGATNTITGIATAYMDSIPVVLITGQVASSLIGRDVFQEADITGATAPFCKHNYLVREARDLPRIIKEAFFLASTGRPGPVVVDIPVDIQNREISFNYPEKIGLMGYKPTYKGNAMQVRRAAETLKKARRPVICSGGGVISANASDRLVSFAEKAGIPVTTTLMGIGSIPSEHPLNLGMIGSHGVYAANYALNNADLLVILGARAGDRAMGTSGKAADRAAVIHIDIDPAEIGKNVDTDVPLVGDVRQVLQELAGQVEAGGYEEWAGKLEKLRNSRNKPVEPGEDGPVKPAYLLEALSRIAGDNTVITTEVGQNQIWAANHYKIRRPRTFISSGGMGTMGYGLPAAIGAKIGRPEAKVVAISGDGSFQMSMQELGVIKQQQLGVKIIIFNNSRLGMVREIQKQKYQGRYSQVHMEHNPDFVRLAEAYGIQGRKITTNREVEGALEEILSDDRPWLLECIVDPEEPTI